MALATSAVAVAAPLARHSHFTARHTARGVAIKYRFPVVSATGCPAHSFAASRTSVVCSAAGDADRESDDQGFKHELNNNLSDLGPWGTGGMRQGGRNVSWSSLEELSMVPPGKHVYILVFGAGSGSEGVYSLQERTREDVPVDIILAFPTYEDASRYATLLEAEMGRVPIVEAALPDDLMYTCQEGGYRCKVARRGVLLVPPEKTVAVTDWERANALRQGQWTVAESEDGCAVFAGAGDTATSTCSTQEEEDEVREEAMAEAATFDVEASREMLARIYKNSSDDDSDPTI